MENRPVADNPLNDDLYPDIPNTASATECTGMMYAPPQSEDELDSYHDLFTMQYPNKNDKSNK